MELHNVVSIAYYIT